MENNQEIQLEEAESLGLTEKYNALQELKDNKAFKTLILDGYMKEKAVDTTSLLATEYGKEIRNTLFEELVAISRFEGYLHMVENLGAAVIDDALEEMVQ